MDCCGKKHNDLITITENCRSRSSNKLFFKMPRWIRRLVKTNKDTERKINGNCSCLVTGDFTENVKLDAETGNTEKIIGGRDTTDIDLKNVITVVTMMYTDNIRMEKELRLLKEGQCSCEQKIQAIQDSHAAIISSKDAKYDLVVEQLKATNDFVLQLMNNYNADCQRLKENIKTCVELGAKNSTDINNCNNKIEKLRQKTVVAVDIQDDALIDAKRTVAEEIHGLKSKIAMVEQKCNEKNSNIYTDMKNTIHDMKKDMNNIKKDLRDIKKSGGLQDERTSHNNWKYDKLKMRLSGIERDMKHQSQQFTQNILMMSIMHSGGAINQPNSVYVQPAPFSPKLQSTTSSVSRSIPPSAPPPPPAPSAPPTALPKLPSVPRPPPEAPQAQQFSTYIITGDMLDDMHKQLRKKGEEIRKIPRRTDMSIPKSIVVIHEQSSEPPSPPPATEYPLTECPLLAPSSPSPVAECLSPATESSTLVPTSPLSFPPSPNSAAECPPPAVECSPIASTLPPSSSPSSPPAAEFLPSAAECSSPAPTSPPPLSPPSPSPATESSTLAPMSPPSSPPSANSATECPPPAVECSPIASTLPPLSPPSSPPAAECSSPAPTSPPPPSPSSPPPATESSTLAPTSAPSSPPSPDSAAECLSPAAECSPLASTSPPSSPPSSPPAAECPHSATESSPLALTSPPPSPLSPPTAPTSPPPFPLCLLL